MYVYMGFSSSTRGKEPGCPCIRDAGSVSGLGRSPGGGHGNPLRYPCLENPADRGAWWSTVHGVAKSWTRLKQPSAHTHTHTHRHTHTYHTYREREKDPQRKRETETSKTLLKKITPKMLTVISGLSDYRSLFQSSFLCVSGFSKFV